MHEAYHARRTHPHMHTRARARTHAHTHSHTHPHTHTDSSAGAGAGAGAGPPKQNSGAKIPTAAAQNASTTKRPSKASAAEVEPPARNPTSIVRYGEEGRG